MATEDGKASGDTVAPTKADLNALGGKIEAMEEELFKKLAGLIAPLTEQITQLNLLIQAMAKIAEGAMDTCVAQHDDIRALQTETNSLTEKAAILANKQRFFNLKFRGLQEKIEDGTGLYTFMTRWLAGVLKLKDRGPLFLTQAYRVGRLNVPNRPMPRDVIVTFVDVCTKNKVLDMARDTGYVLYKDECIHVYKDLAPEALAKKGEFKEILAILRDMNIWHRWASPIKLQLFYKGKTHFIKMEEEGLDLLQALGVATPMTTERASAKCRLALQTSPPQASKRSNKNWVH